MTDSIKEADAATTPKDFIDSRPDTPSSETPTPVPGISEEPVKKSLKPFKYTSTNATAQASTSRTKTFTGCWTCRARKIKCDLRRPTCFRCEKANLQCAGYSIKLRWSPSNAKGETNDTTPSTGEEDFFQRRNVEFVQYPPHMVYEYYEDMDLILSKLHSPKIIDDETKVLGPFGVFQGVRNAKRRLPNNKKAKRRKLSPDPKGTKKGSPGTTEPSPLSNSPSSQASPMTLIGTSGSPLNPDRTPFQEPEPDAKLDSISGLESLLEESHPDSVIADSNFMVNEISRLHDFTQKPNIAEPDFNAHLFQSNELLDSLHNDIFHIDILANSTFPDKANEVDELFAPLDGTEQDQQQDIRPDPNLEPHPDPNSASNSDLFMSLTGPHINHFLSQDFNLGIPTNSQYFQPQSRYLLNHYIKNVARVMTVVAHEKTAWKTIYFPRAISAIGELVGLGTCSNPRRSLLHALLSISSFHIASKLPPGSDQKLHYSQLGASLKNQALQSLHNCLQSESLTSLKHKDIMTAMLSMVTIDVVSGEMKECRLHLQGCKHLVTKRRQSGRRISKKALVLHRISSFLCLLQDATTLNPTLMDDSVIDNRKWDDFVEISELGLGSPDAYTRTFNNNGNIEGFVEEVETKSSPESAPESLESLSYIQSESQLREYWNQYSKNTPHIETFYDSELVSTHAMYCIPDSLTLLFSRTVKLSRQVCYMRWKRQKINKATVEKCNLLQKSLQEWGQWYNESRLPKEFTGDVRTAIDLHTSAFYYSLLIYHYTNVREINPASLQGFVRIVLDRLDSLLALNHDKANPLIIPLLFPAFIAACEALSPENQLAFNEFFNQLALQGLGTYFQARRVVEEVWKRRSENRARAAWRYVLQDENVNIMLS